ncbi:MAG: undecaprenyl-diphosphate phosphatase [SAR202 cluster bacterium]|nr:undecaprenyl-diphosphate phosphatase [SAR202 cluster bacterium]|tara:strand:+ start:27740 stop:28534 length:795 start_codon:yes stop_codon:yes gene_type:complete
MEKSGIFTAIVLGVVQGIFEWLPVSSHLVINHSISLLGKSFLDYDLGYGFWLHLGTMLSVVTLLRKNLIVDFRKIVIDQNESFINIFKLFLISTGISLFFGSIFFLILRIQLINWVGIVVMGVFGLLLFAEGLSKRRNFRRISGFNLWDSLLVGFFQGLAVVPGVSRSGLAMSILVKRKLNIHHCFLLNCYLNIPLSLASVIYMGISGRILVSYDSIISLISSFFVGLICLSIIFKTFEKFEERKLKLATAFLILGSCLYQLIV